MFTKKDLQHAVYKALIKLDGSAHIKEIARHINENHIHEIQGSDIEFTWHYDMRWQATYLRKRGLIKPANESPKGYWELT